MTKCHIRMEIYTFDGDHQVNWREREIDLHNVSKHDLEGIVLGYLPCDWRDVFWSVHSEVNQNPRDGESNLLRWPKESHYISPANRGKHIQHNLYNN